MIASVCASKALKRELIREVCARKVGSSHSGGAGHALRVLLSDGTTIFASLIHRV
jgi:hypothetical protein